MTSGQAKLTNADQTQERERQMEVDNQKWVACFSYSRIRPASSSKANEGS